ncbi:MAG: hypothetical protein PHN71_07285, partial [Candidatus Cloacimonetes bacterium]|nr:hypothetical protein [Candidatus Cloacimonadota bacterium]
MAIQYFTYLNLQDCRAKLCTGGRRTAYSQRALQRAPVPSGLPSSLGRGSEAAREKRPSAFVANRACHPGLPLELENLMTEMRMFWIIDKDNR